MARQLMFSILGPFRAVRSDANRWILIETRAKRLGIYGKCATCEGRGDVFIEPAAKLSLVVWILHPRKGASCGASVTNIQENDMPAVVKWLNGAAMRNAMRFGKVRARALASDAEAT